MRPVNNETNYRHRRAKKDKVQKRVQSWEITNFIVHYKSPDYKKNGKKRKQ